MKEFIQCKMCSHEVTPYISDLKLVKCNNCQLIFYKLSVSPDDLKEIYKNLYNKDGAYHQHNTQGLQLKMGMQPRLGYNKEKVIKKILKNKKGISIAEIGAGVGIVAKRIIGEGHNYVGLEIEEGVAKNAAAIGLPIKAIGYEGLKEFNGNLDAVLAFEVLEHIENLDDCFRLINSSLKTGGLLGFTVPNTEKYKNFESIQTRLFQDPPPVHVNFFTTTSMQNILSLYGFEPILLKVRPFPYISLNSVKTYKYLFKIITRNFYGPNILVVAKKIDNYNKTTTLSPSIN